MRLFPRIVDQFVPVVDTPARRPMPLGTTVARYLIRVTGSLTVGVAVATILDDSPYGLIKSVDLVVNGGKPLRAHPARFLGIAWNPFQFGTGKRSTAPSGAVGTTAFMAEFEIDLAQWDIYGLERYFVLDTRLYSSVELVYNIGNAADVATLGGGGSVSLSNLLIQTFAEDIADVGGFASRVEIRRLPQTIGATGALTINTLPALGAIYRAIVLHTVSGNADPIRGTDDDTVITDVSLKAGSVVHFDKVPWEQLRANNKAIAGLETMPAGWGVLDFAPNHNLEELLRTARARQLLLELTIGAAPANTWLEVYPVAMQLLQKR